MYLEWSAVSEPTASCPYTHVTKGAQTYRIEWKSWKPDSGYVVYRDEEYVGCEYSLEDAKTAANNDMKGLLT